VFKDVCQRGCADRATIWSDPTYSERQQFQTLLASPPIAISPVALRRRSATSPALWLLPLMEILVMRAMLESLQGLMLWQLSAKHNLGSFSELWRVVPPSIKSA
jgi:23S rRNA A2030 N6-methylase RlmJ